MFPRRFVCILAARSGLWLTTQAAAAQAQPTNVAARHVSGQTFLTCDERTDLPAATYRVYRHDAPITAGNLDEATLLAEVPTGSAQFYASRYADYTNPPAWRTRYASRLTVEDGGTPLAVGRGLLVWTVTSTDTAAGHLPKWPWTAGLSSCRFTQTLR